ncbi:MAG: ABC transporter ATP-binding protein [Pseudomonadales bacterium]|jgi:putative ABC transport system ATP-binding protein|nr:ABC transporter ATP-binding protein [Pseudomonadales bacterium]
MAIELMNVRFHYPEQPGQIVLNIPSWSLPGGKQVFVHGPSGGGKSTLLNLLSGLFIPNGGQVEILGKRLEQMTSRKRDKFRAKHIGYVFQQFNLIPYLNAFDNTQLANRFARQKKPASDDEIKQLLISLNIAEKDWYRPARSLSIGQQQRVAIARALVNKPQLLIVDEPTSSLDSTNKDAFMALLMSIVTDNNITLVFVSHDLSLARYFNRVESLSDINRLDG